MVSDITRMGEWSPEAGRGRWIGRRHEPVVGARFIGTNRRKWRRWATLCRVSTSVQGEAFAFVVTFGPLQGAEWRYQFEQEGNRCRVTESWFDRRGWFLRLAGKLVTGVSNRAVHNRESMVATLNALSRAASPT